MAEIRWPILSYQLAPHPNREPGCTELHHPLRRAPLYPHTPPCGRSPFFSGAQVLNLAGHFCYLILQALEQENKREGEQGEDGPGENTASDHPPHTHTQLQLQGPWVGLRGKAPCDTGQRSGTAGCGLLPEAQRQELGLEQQEEQSVGGGGHWVSRGCIRGDRN